MSAENTDRPTPGPAGEQHALADRPAPPAIRRGPLTGLAVIIVLAAFVIAVVGILERRHAAAKLADYTNSVAAPAVTLVEPKLEKSAREIVLPGNMQAFTQAPIYARTTGYVKAWYHDIGSHVKKGDLLAVIETPELDQQLAQAKADLATAQANAALAKVTADRYQGLLAQNAVSQQDTDNARSALAARNTEVTSADANVKRLAELQSFERITAPFDGVVTARNLDIGQLVTTAGSTTTPGAGIAAASREVFDIAAIGTLRVFVNVPQVYAPDAKTGVIASLSLPQYPGRSFKGRLVRTSNAVDPATRTLLAEVDVDNRGSELLPGSYTEVHLNVSSTAPALTIPAAAAILKPDGLHVGVVDSSSHARMARIVPGRDDGNVIEVLGGITSEQKIIANPPDSLTDGEEVRVMTPQQAAQQQQQEGEQ